MDYGNIVLSSLHMEYSFSIVPGDQKKGQVRIAERRRLIGEELFIQSIQRSKEASEFSVDSFAHQKKASRIVCDSRDMNTVKRGLEFSYGKVETWRPTTHNPPTNDTNIE